MSSLFLYIYIIFYSRSDTIKSVFPIADTTKLNSTSITSTSITMADNIGKSVDSVECIVESNNNTIDTAQIYIKQMPTKAISELSFAFLENIHGDTLLIKRYVISTNLRKIRKIIYFVDTLLVGYHKFQLIRTHCGIMLNSISNTFFSGEYYFSKCFLRRLKLFEIALGRNFYEMSNIDKMIFLDKLREQDKKRKKV